MNEVERVAREFSHGIGECFGHYEDGGPCSFKCIEDSHAAGQRHVKNEMAKRIYTHKWDEDAADRATVGVAANPFDPKREAARVAHCNGQQVGRTYAEQALLLLLEEIVVGGDRRGDGCVCPDCGGVGVDNHVEGKCPLYATIKRIKGE